MIAILIIYISIIIIKVIDDSNRPQRFKDSISEIKNKGGKIRYMNEKTGTISYVDRNGKYISCSIYKGYNSHSR